VRRIPTPLLPVGPPACRRSRFVSTRAIQTTVFAAQMTGSLKPLAQLRPGPVQPDVEVVQGRAQRSSGVFWRDAFEIHTLKHRAVLFWQAGQRAFHTLAKHALDGRIRSFRNLLLQAFKRAVPYIAPPIEVDNGMTQDAIEPRHRALSVFGTTSGSKCFEQGVLHQVGGQLRIAHAFACECNKGIQVLEKRIFGLFHRAKFTVLLPPGNHPRRIADLSYNFECKRIFGPALARVKEAVNRSNSEHPYED